MIIVAQLTTLSVAMIAMRRYTPLYRNVFNRYAASIKPPAFDWVGGIIMLRDGLDSANVTRFPEATFGPSTPIGQSGDRMLKIAHAFAEKGAAVGDVKAATGCPTASRHATKMNDVGYRIWQGNYGNGLLTQLKPMATSVGRWRVGPQDQPYGRFARQFEHATGKTAMGFMLDNRLWGGLPLSTPAAGSAALELTIAVVYFDGDGSESSSSSRSSNGGDALVIRYDAVGGKCVTVAKLPITNTGRWIKWSTNVSDAAFAGARASCAVIGTTDNADVVLAASGGSLDIVISTIEVFAPAGVP